MSDVSAPRPGPDELVNQLFQGGAIPGAVDLIGDLLGLAIGTVKGLLAKGSGLEELARQESMEQYRPALVSLEALHEGLRRNMISEGEAQNVLERAGFTDRAVAVLLELRAAVLPMPEAREAYRRKTLSADGFAAVAEAHGFSPADAELMASNSATPLDAGTLIVNWRRGYIDELELAAGLDRLGYKGGDVAKIMQVALEVPNPTDLVRFLARDVYSPEIRGALQLDDDFPVGALDQFRAAGLSDEYTRDLWAAHWVLPPLTQAYRLFWRKLISRDDLEFIMRAADVLPMFRGPLIDAAYRVPTRVDARRFHKLGLVDEAELQSIYERQGFSPADAKLMVEFTVQYNGAGDQADETEVRKLTKAQIVKLYSQSLISRDLARQALVGIAYSERDAETFLDLVDLELAEDQRDLQVEVVRRQFKSGLIDYNTAVDRLNVLDLPAQELQRLLVIFEAEQATKIHLPTRSELDKMRKEQIIDTDTYRTELIRLGWPPVWADRWAQVTEPDAVPDLGEPITLDLPDGRVRFDLNDYVAG